MGDSLGPVATQPILSEAEIHHLGAFLAEMAMSPMPNPKASESRKQGEQASRYLGSGMEYEESRLYQPGDEVRRINWRLMARTGHAYTKLFQEERQESWTLVVDQRQSMRFGTKKRLKVTQAARIAGFYAWQAQTAGLPVEAISLSETVKSTPILEGKGSFERLMAFLSIPRPPLDVPQESRLHDELVDCQKKLQAGSRLVVISDFHDLDESTLMVLAALQEKVMIKAILVYDEVEKQLPNINGLKLQSLDGHQTVDSLSAVHQRAYQQWSRQYFAEIRAKLERVGVKVIELSTSESLMRLNEQ